MEGSCFVQDAANVTTRIRSSSENLRLPIAGDHVNGISKKGKRKGHYGKR